jgi:hypothetical protein
MDDTWGTIEETVRWLGDSSMLAPETEKLLRIMKLAEEAGEVTQAVAGTLGQNPRKGVTHSCRGSAPSGADFARRVKSARSAGRPHSPRSRYSSASGVRNRVRISWRHGMPTGGQGTDLPDRLVR